jgi:hypothetical protein
MILANIIDWLFASTALLTAFALGASFDRINRWVAKLTKRNIKSRPIRPQPARLWVQSVRDWQIHGNN